MYNCTNNLKTFYISTIVPFNSDEQLELIVILSLIEMFQNSNLLFVWSLK